VRVIVLMNVVIVCSKVKRAVTNTDATSLQAAVADAAK
jgi:hypothetical protein